MSSAANAPPASKQILRVLLIVLVVGVLVRLYHVDIPPLDAHSPRQNDTAALAKNFYDGAMNPLYPQVDWRGNSDGYVEVEFQVYTYTVALLYKVFGPHIALARLLNIFFYCLSALLLFGLTRRLFHDRAAVAAVFFYSLVPLSVFFTRSVQPDALMSLCTLATLYYFWRWTEGGKGHLLAVSGLALSIALLIKPPNLYLGLPLLYLCHRRFRWKLFKRPELWVYAVAVCIPAALWFRHALGLWEMHGNTFGILGIKTVARWWAPTDPQWRELLKNLLDTFGNEIAPATGMLLAVIGLMTRPRSGNYLLQWWLAGFAVYVLLVAHGHSAHNYYQLPIVFVMAAFMGVAAVSLLDREVIGRRGMAVVLLVMFLVAGIRLRQLYYVADNGWAHVAFCEEVEALTGRDELIVWITPLRDTHQPLDYRHRTAEGELLYSEAIDFYLSDRNGFSIDAGQATMEFLETLRLRGAKYVALSTPTVFDQRPGLEAALNGRYELLGTKGRGAIFRMAD